MDKNKKRKIIDKKSLHDFVYTTSLAFTMQTLVATIVMFISSSSTASEQSRISSIYETPGFLSKSTLPVNICCPASAFREVAYV